MNRSPIVMFFCLSAACSEMPGEPQPVHWLDYQVFVVEVQPILGERCGNPSCHGRVDRPFAIYSPLRWRQDPDRTHLPEPLSDDEAHANYALSCVFVDDPGEPETSLLLRKPLGPAAGWYHGGGSVFDSTRDRDYRTVRRWILGGTK